jgi:hypothetical protein
MLLQATGPLQQLPENDTAPCPVQLALANGCIPSHQEESIDGFLAIRDQLPELLALLHL